MFKTLQDRLVKDLRLAGIATIEAANQFVETWLPRDNLRFAVPPAQAADLHRPSPGSRELDRILCVKTTRVVRRDWTVAHNRQLYQIDQSVRTTQVLVEDRLDGSMRITHHGRSLGYHAITSRPYQGGGLPAAHPEAASRQTEAGASVASPLLTRASQRRGDVDDLTPDISTLGKSGHFLIGLTSTQFMVDLDRECEQPGVVMHGNPLPLLMRRTP